ncbi:metallophosphoesterase [bacterium]|nr:metallophosphoesterase [bacterium]
MTKFITKLFYLLLIIFISVQVSYAKDLRIVQVTDANIKNEDVSLIKQTVSDINTLKDVDMVIFTGDNMSEISYENFYAYLKALKKLKTPYYIISGEKDLFYYGGFGKKEFCKMVSHFTKYMHSGKPRFIVRKKGYIVLFEDGSKQYIPGSNGYFSDEYITKLNKRLKKYKNKKVIIVQHYPLLDHPDRPSKNTYNREYYLNMLKLHNNVITIISGHFDLNNEQYVDGIYHIITPSLTSNMYKIIDIKSDKNETTIFTQLRNVKTEE